MLSTVSHVSDKYKTIGISTALTICRWAIGNVPVECNPVFDHMKLTSCGNK
jgi:hypothetical protein